jgi:hypothetical protein
MSMATPTTNDAAIKAAYSALKADAQGNTAGWISAFACWAAAASWIAWLAIAHITDSALRRDIGVTTLILFAVCVLLLIFAVVRLTTKPMTVSEARGLLRTAYIEQAVTAREVTRVNQPEGSSEREASG